MIEAKREENVGVRKEQTSFGRNSRFSHFRKKQGRKLNFAVFHAAPTDLIYAILF